MTVQPLISELLDGIKKVYIDKQTTQGIRSSGKSAESLRIEAGEKEGALYGAKYFYQQKFGRKPGKFPPIDDILDWIRAKGITPRDTKTTQKQLAYLFARKIAQSGTEVYQKKRDGLAVEEEVKVLVKDFQDKLNGEFKAAIKASF
jgi:hypothetical protein